MSQHLIDSWFASAMRQTIALVALLSAGALFAQDPTPTPTPTPTTGFANIYAGGVSYNPGASPAIAGTGLYARQLIGGTYAFTVVDALPITIRPFTVNTNVGVGLAQRVATIGGIPIYVPTSAGISFNGANTGWSWSTGGLAWIRVKGNWAIAPHVRLLKSSVSNNAGYGVIVGMLVGWGK